MSHREKNLCLFQSSILALALWALNGATSVTAQIPGYNSTENKSTYWQQHVDYIIDVTLNDDGRTITGTEIFTYTNNSPDTLHSLYLKAFPNSARKGSLMDMRNRESGDYSLANADSSKWGYLYISEARGRGGKKLSINLDDTIYEILLKRPVAPGGFTRISLDFETRLPVGIGDRHHLISGQSKAAYWYPQVCVYDRKMGWVNSQYIGRGECYGDFGDFTVSISAPEDRIVAATGMLTNRKEVLPDTLRAKLDIMRFVAEPEEWPKFDFDNTKFKTWKFFAKKVNDFAWVAAPNFCLDEQMYNGVQIEIFPQRANARSWIKAKEYAARSLETFSELYGDYGWPQIKVTDSYDGMEYPMITFCRGGDPDPDFPLLIYHEIGHFWFMGLVGSNQVDRPFLDEGFTTMAEIVAMERYHGRKGNNVSHAGNWYKEKFYPQDEDRDARGYRIYLDWVRSGYDLPMIISADNATEYWAYRNSSYYKPVVMHFSLRAIYGDQLYFRAMRTYGRKWFYKHPYEDDFVRSFSGVVGERLDEYFEQWFTSRKQIDYKYESHKQLSGDSIPENTYTIKLSRPGDFATPVDIAFINNSDDTTFYTVNPEGHHYLKSGYQDGGTWRQYRQPAGKYSFVATVPGGISKAVIDPDNLLPDVNRLNNESGFLPPIETRFDAMFFDIPSMHKYSLRLRPDFWYDRPNGLIIGGHAHGSYIKKANKFSLDFGVGAESGRALVDLKVSHPTNLFGKLSYTKLRAFHSDYRTFFSAGYSKEFREKWTGDDFSYFELRTNFLDVDGSGSANTSDALSPLSGKNISEFIGEGRWDDGETSWLSLLSRNQTVNRYVDFKGEARGDYIFRGGKSNSSPSFTRIQTDFQMDFHLQSGARLELSTSFFLFYGSAVNDAFLYHISRPTPIDAMLGSNVFRSPGTFPTAWRVDFYLAEGFINRRVRGYQNRSFYGTEGRTFSAIITDINLLKKLGFNHLPHIGSFLSRTLAELFVQTGFIEQKSGVAGIYETPLKASDETYFTSAGVSFSTPSVWNGQKLRFDLPLYLSHPLPGEEKWQFRLSAALVLPLNTERWR